MAAKIPEGVDQHLLEMLAYTMGARTTLLTATDCNSMTKIISDLTHIKDCIYATPAPIMYSLISTAQSYGDRYDGSERNEFIKCVNCVYEFCLQFELLKSEIRRSPVFGELSATKRAQIKDIVSIVATLITLPAK